MKVTLIKRFFTIGHCAVCPSSISKPGMNSGVFEGQAASEGQSASEGQAVNAALMTPVVLLVLQTR